MSNIIKKRFGRNNNPYWDKNKEFNLMFFQSQMNLANDKLTHQGHVLLLDVYDMLGIARTKESCYLGLVKGVNKNEDYVKMSYEELLDHPNEFELTFECYPILEYLEVENVAG